MALMGQGRTGHDDLHRLLMQPIIMHTFYGITATGVPTVPECARRSLVGRGARHTPFSVPRSKSDSEQGGEALDITPVVQYRLYE